MNGKQKKKVFLAVAFVIVCGLVYAAVCFGSEQREPTVLETKKTSAETGVTDRAKEEAKAQIQEPEAEDVPEEFPGPVVHVCGAVKTEGVYSLLPDSRIGDAITAAGGFAETADITFHNLAAKVTDGQQIYVPTKEETKEMTVEERAGNGTEMSRENPRVNLNRAGKEELMTLSGIGEAKAEAILQYRKKVGPFQSIEDLKNISGIGDAMFERIKDRITVE